MKERQFTQRSCSVDPPRKDKSHLSRHPGQSLTASGAKTTAQNRVLARGKSELISEQLDVELQGLRDNPDLHKSGGGGGVFATRPKAAGLLTS